MRSIRAIAATWLAILCLAGCATVPAAPAPEGPIDRRAVISRQNVTLDAIDPHAAVMVGNGSLALSLDITGLQGLCSEYAETSPLITQAQWAWHSFPNPEGWTLEYAMKPVDAHGQVYQYPYIADWAELDTNPALQWLRENPHRFSLGRLSFRLVDETGGRPLELSDISETRLTLDLWSGTAESQFSLEGKTVRVSTQVHPDLDTVLISVDSPLLANGRLVVDLDFPYVSEELNPDPADWTSPERHTSTLLEEKPGRDLIERRLDDARYYVTAQYGEDGSFTQTGVHRFTAGTASGGTALHLAISYALVPGMPGALDFAALKSHAARAWPEFWQSGGIIDLSASDDPRAVELERRIVLSQYLTKVNASSSWIPQEEGLYANSWNGKFHHEMHWWHAAHFALWGRAEVTAESLDWYKTTLPQARARATHYGRTGAWWPKMTGANGVESPSTINPFIMWQQPHPIYLAELVYRADPSEETLAAYGEVVDETANLLASFLTDTGEDRLVLGPPVIPVQEVWPATATTNPTFEVAYWGYGLKLASEWRARRGLAPEPAWNEALARLPALPEEDGLYLPVAEAGGFWRDVARPECAGGLGAKGGAIAEGGPPDETCLNRDHPSFLMALGFLPESEADAETMARTLEATNRLWDLRQTWGWDFPMMAMTAARLGEPELAVDYLMMDAANNQFGVTGMTPRYHLGEEGYTRAADTYFPSNGGLLAAVALMAAGWDGTEGDAPGFPEQGWVVRHEGLKPLP